MIVRCVKILSPDGQVIDDHPAVQIGRDYLVLEIFSQLGPNSPTVLLRVLDEQREDREPFGGHSLWPAEMFETVSGRIPTCWTTRLGDGLLVLAPASWHRPGFWEHYYSDWPEHADHSAHAWADYRTALTQIKAER